MFKEIFRNTELNGLFPIIVLIFFLVAFIAVIIISLRLNSKHIEHMKNLPLEKDNNENIKNGG
jgi:hypothetical protein